MSEPVRLSKRLAELTGCSRREAEQYIEGGWVSVDGVVVESPQMRVADEAVVLAPGARLEAPEPATLLLHKPAGVEIGSHADAALLTAERHWQDDLSAIRPLKRHLLRLSPAMPPLAREDSGLVVLTQDGRVWKRLTEDANSIEHEYLVEVGGTIAPHGLARLASGLEYRGRPLPPCKVSWQNEIRLRFAIKAVQPGQLRDVCAQVGLDVVAIRRLRIGSIALGKMPPGEWRYLPASTRF